jgi:hypothetical protein
MRGREFKSHLRHWFLAELKSILIFSGWNVGPIPFFNYADSYNASAPIENGYEFVLLVVIELATIYSNSALKGMFYGTFYSLPEVRSMNLNLTLDFSGEM